MSVLKNNRGESGAEFLNVAYKLEIFTIESCSRLPRRFMHTISDRIVNMSIDCHFLLKSANSIYPRNKHEAQLRRDLLQNAINCVESMGTQIQILYEVSDKLSMEVMSKWAELLEFENKLVRGLMRKDAERFKHLT